MQQNKPVGIDQAVARLQLRHLVVFSALQMLQMLTIWNFIAGTIFLILRQSGVVALDFTSFSLAGIPVSLLAAMAAARRRAIPRATGLAIIDSYNKAGGLLLAEFETGDRSWIDRQPVDCRVPDLSADFRSRMPALLISAVFLLLCLYLPIYSRFLAVDPRLDLKNIEKTAAAQIEALAEENLLAPTESQELRQALEAIGADSDRNDPAGAFEALDQLQEKLRTEAAANALKMLTELEKLQQLDAQADKLGEMAGQGEGGGEGSAAGAAGDLKKTLQSTEAGQSLPEDLANSVDKKLEKVSEGGAGARDAAVQAEKELKDYISRRAEEISRAAEKMLKARLIDKETFEKLKKEGRIKPATEKDLQDNPDAELIMAPCDGGDGQSGNPGNGASGAAMQGNSPGQGAPNRGGGTAPLNFNRRTSEHNTGFRDEMLPAPTETALEDSVAIGTSLSAPLIESDNQAGQQAKTPQWKQPGKSAAESVIILPRHRNAVKKYFDHSNP